MKEVSNAYKESMKQDVRNRSTMIVAIGDINPILQTEATGREGYEGQVAFFCRPYYMTNGIVFRNGTDLTYSSLEHNFTPADGSMMFVPYNTPEADLIDTGLTTYSHVRYETSQAIDVMFPSEGVKAPFEITVEMREYIPTMVTIELHGDEGQIEFYTFYDATTRRLTHTFDTLPESTSGQYHLAILFSLKEETDLSQRARIKSIIFGSGVCIFPDIIESAETRSYSSVTGENLPTDDLTLNLINYNARYDADNPNNPLAILDNKNQEINVYYGYDVEDDETYEWIKGCSVLAADWNSKQHKATIIGADRIRNDDSLFIHSYNTLSGSNYMAGIIWYILAKMKADIPFEYTINEPTQINDYLNNTIVATAPCKDLLQQVANFFGMTMYFKGDGRLVFSPQTDYRLELFEETTFVLDPDNPIHQMFTIPDLSICDNGIFTVHVVGYDRKMSRNVDVIEHTRMDKITSSDELRWNFYSDIDYATKEVVGTCTVTTHRAYAKDDHFNMGKDDIIEDIVANKEERIGEIIVPYTGRSWVTTETTEVASVVCDISDIESGESARFDVSLGGTVYTNKYVYQADMASTISTSDFYVGDISHSNGTNVESTTALRSGFETVSGGDYFRITCDEDKIIVGFAEYSTNASSGFIKWVDVNDDKCVKKMSSNTTRVRIVIAYADESTITLGDLENPRLSWALRESYKTANDYAIVTVEKANFPTATSLEIFVTAKGYINFVQNDYVKSLNQEGKSVRWENPLISSKNEAARVANYLAAKLKDNIIYEYEYRGNPELDVGDIIRQENDFNPNLKVVIQEHKIGFNGALSGEIVAKRRLDT